MSMSRILSLGRSPRRLMTSTNNNNGGILWTSRNNNNGSTNNNFINTSSTPPLNNHHNCGGGGCIQCRSYHKTVYPHLSSTTAANSINTDNTRTTSTSPSQQQQQQRIDRDRLKHSEEEEDEVEDHQHMMNSEFGAGDSSSTTSSISGDSSRHKKRFYTPSEFYALMHYVDERTRVRGYSIMKILLGISGVTLFLWWFFHDQIKDAAAHHTADVASRSLSSGSVQDSASNLSKSVLQEILNDPEMRNQALLFVADLLQRQETSDAAKTLVVQLFNDPRVQQELNKLVLDQWNRLMNDEYARQQATNLAYYVIMQQSTQKALGDQAISIVRTDSFQDSVNTLFMNSLHSQPVKTASHELASYTIGQMLESEEVNKNVKMWANGILADEALRMKGGEALWGVVRWGVLPRWWAGSSETADSSKTASTSTGITTQPHMIAPSTALDSVSVAHNQPAHSTITASALEQLIENDQTTTRTNGNIFNGEQHTMISASTQE